MEREEELWIMSYELWIVKEWVIGQKDKDKVKVKAKENST